MTYNALNAIFLAAAIVFGLFTLGKPGWILAVKVLVPMLVLTAVFDNAIILSGIVDYHDANISGLRIGAAPIEDFAYTVFVSILVPALWLKRGDK